MPMKARSHLAKKQVRTPELRLSAHKRGYDRRWQRLRLVVLSIEPLCRICNELGLAVPAEDVDHIVRRSDGGTDELSNLQPLCHVCHSRKTAREMRSPRAEQ